MTDEELEILDVEVLTDSNREGDDLSGEESSGADYQEVVLADEPHLFYETDFSSYTVTEGLLLLIFVILLVQFFLNLVRRWI